MNNKLLSILGICILSIALVACSNSNEKNNGANEENIPTNEPENDPSDTAEEPTEPAEPEVPEEPEENPLLLVDDETIIVLVNKEYSLGDNYVPDDLVTVDVPTILDNPEVNQLRLVAADALKALFDEAEATGFYLHARSGYRSYQTQTQLFQSYTERNGEEAANRYSAKPGHSEHQTGLVMDVTSESVNYQLDESFGKTDEGIWISEHAHEFGFIVRYPENGEAITGYVYEPWHLRYLGVDMASAVYNSGLTYEAFLEEEELTSEVNS